jgi:hypothetical protein
VAEALALEGEGDLRLGAAGRRQRTGEQRAANGEGAADPAAAAGSVWVWGN